MAIVNVSKPTSSLTNQTKINIGETWGSDLNEWQNESRTWAETASIILNIVKNNTEYLATEALDYLMTEDDNYLVTGAGLITNQSKPI